MRKIIVIVLGVILLAHNVVFLAIAAEGNDENIFVMPYKKYEITQDCHEDGWPPPGPRCAIDLGAGRGANILASINGEIIGKGKDRWGNPYLILQNTRWTVYLLHGIYTVEVGGKVRLNQKVGEESNIGNVRCKGDGKRPEVSKYGPNCGYHTHLTLYDNVRREWVDPRLAAKGLILLPPTEPVQVLPQTEPPPATEVFTIVAPIPTNTPIPLPTRPMETPVQPTETPTVAALPTETEQVLPIEPTPFPTDLPPLTAEPTEILFVTAAPKKEETPLSTQTETLVERSTETALRLVPTPDFSSLGVSDDFSIIDGETDDGDDNQEAYPQFIGLIPPPPPPSLGGALEQGLKMADPSELQMLLGLGSFFLAISAFGLLKRSRFGTIGVVGSGIIYAFIFWFAITGPEFGQQQIAYAFEFSPRQIGSEFEIPSYDQEDIPTPHFPDRPTVTFTPASETPVPVTVEPTPTLVKEEPTKRTTYTMLLPFIGNAPFPTPTPTPSPTLTPTPTLTPLPPPTSTPIPPAEVPGQSCSKDTFRKFPENVSRWHELICRESAKNKLDPALIAAVVWQESGGNSLAYSHSGAVGLMQVMPRDGIAARFQCKNGPCFADRPTIKELENPEFNVLYGTRFLANLIKHYGNLRDALKHYGPKDVGYSYADKIISIWQNYK